MPTYLWLTLAAALAHGFSFVWSRELVRRAGGSQARSAFLSLLALAIPALCMAPFTGLRGIAKAPELLLAIALSGALSQSLLMGAMRRAHASFVVPAVGVKVFFVAALAALLFSETYDATVYLGAAGSVAALFVLNRSRIATTWAGLAFVVGTAFFYAVNDVLILAQIRAGYTPQEVFVYAGLGPALVAILISVANPQVRAPPSAALLRALAVYGAVHGAGLLALMVAIDLGRQVTLVNVLHNARGMFAVLFVALLGYRGVLGVERLSAHDFRVRLAGAALMTASIAVAVLGR